MLWQAGWSLKLHQNKKLKQQQGSRFLSTFCEAWGWGWTSSEGLELSTCPLLRSRKRGWRWSYRWWWGVPCMRKESGGMQTVSSHILASCEENYSPEEGELRTAPLPRPLLSTVQIKWVEHVLGNSSVVLKPPLICVKGLRSFPSIWLFVLYI